MMSRPASEMQMNISASLHAIGKPELMPLVEAAAQLPEEDFEMLLILQITARRAYRLDAAKNAPTMRGKRPEHFRRAG